MRSATTLAALVALLGGCDRTEERSASAPGSPKYTSVQQQVVDLPSAARRGVLMRAIQDGAAPCQNVVEEERRHDRAGAPLYVARCKDGPQYAVLIAADGVAQVSRLDR